MRTLTRRVVRHLNRQGRLRGELAAVLWERRRLRRTVRALQGMVTGWQEYGKVQQNVRERLERELGDLRRAHDDLALLQELGEL